MNKRFDGVYFGLQGILTNTLGRQVKIFDNSRENDNVRILEQFELNRNDNDRSLKIVLRFNDASSLILNRVVAATIDWGYLQKRTQPLIWLCDDKRNSIYKVFFDVRNTVISPIERETNYA
jgi:hypothetical protein